MTCRPETGRFVHVVPALVIESVAHSILVTYVSPTPVTEHGVAGICGRICCDNTCDRVACRCTSRDPRGSCPTDGSCSDNGGRHFVREPGHHVVGEHSFF